METPDDRLGSRYGDLAHLMPGFHGCLGLLLVHKDDSQIVEQHQVQYQRGPIRGLHALAYQALVVP